MNNNLKLNDFVRVSVLNGRFDKQVIAIVKGYTGKSEADIGHKYILTTMNGELPNEKYPYSHFCANECDLTKIQNDIKKGDTVKTIDRQWNGQGFDFTNEFYYVLSVAEQDMCIQPSYPSGHERPVFVKKCNFVKLKEYTDKSLCECHPSPTADISVYCYGCLICDRIRGYSGGY